MTRDELLTKLRDLFEREGRRWLSRPDSERREDPEDWHIQADDALIEFINDPEIAEAYGALTKWYA